MLDLDRHPSGRHFLQIPGPTNVPDRVLRAIDRPTIDHRGPEFAHARQDRARRHEEGVHDDVARRHLSVVGHRRVGSGARQHALARRPRADGRDRPLRDAVEAARRAAVARRRLPARRLAPRRRSARDRGSACAPTRAHAIKAVCVVHNETSTGVVSRIADVRAAIDRAGHPALLMVDTVELARLARLPPRRMGRRRDGGRLAEGPDAARRASRSTRSARRRSPPRGRRGCRARTGTGRR